MADTTDVNVDDLRRRARRRLVGAVVLALAAAIFVPILLESDPKPLGEDVSVRIPPIDDGRFVNRLSDKSKGEPAKAKSKDEFGKEPAKQEAPKAEKAEAVAEPAAKAVEPAAAPKRKEGDAEPKVVAARSPAMSAATSAAPSPPAAAAPPAAPAAPANGDASAPGYSVQLAAFADDKGANALSNKLKRAGYPAYTEPLATSRGTLWRVRVGPYPSRETAATSRDKLKGEGYSGIVAPAK